MYIYSHDSMHFLILYKKKKNIKLLGSKND